MAKRIMCLLLALAAALGLGAPAFAAEANGVDAPAAAEEAAAPDVTQAPEETAVPEPTTTPEPVPQKLAAPVLTSAANTDEGIAVAWEAVAGAAKYRVYYKTAGSGWTMAGDTTGTAYTWTKGKPGTAYTITVKAFDEQGEAGAYDSTGLAVTRYLATPKLTAAKWSGSSVTVSWKAVAGAAKYRVYYSVGGGTWIMAGDTTGTSFTWTKGKAGTVYAFTVRCMDSAGKGKTSDYERPGLTPKNAAAPKLTGVSNEPGGMQIKWKAAPGATLYRVYYKTTGGWNVLADTAGTSYTWAGATSGKRYTFTVRGLTDNGRGVTTDYDRTGLSAVYMAPPVLTGASNTNGGVQIRWKAVSGAAKYRVFYKTTGGWTRLADTTGTSYTWAGAKSGTKYAFTVRCLSADGKSYTTAYDTAGVGVLCLSAPKIAELAQTADGVKVTWNAVGGAEKYRVYARTGAGGWTRIAETAGTSYEWTGAESGTEYYYTVRAFDAEGVGGPYDNTGKAATYFPMPVMDRVSSGTKGLTIRWEAVSGAAQYRVFYKTTGGWKKLADTKKTSYTWTDAKSGPTYAFTVRCLSADGKGYTSFYDTAGLRLHYLATPTIDETANRNGGIRVNWDDVGADSYEVYYKVGIDEEGQWELLGETAKTSMYLTDPDSTAKYTFRVRAVADDGTVSGYSEERRSMIFTNSPLADVVIISPNKDTDRNNIIDTITIHCTAGQGYAQSMGNMFAMPSKLASANYGIGKDGVIGLYVDEKDCSWCSSNRPNDNRAITIEVSSDDHEPYWVTPAAYSALLDLVTDICQRNGIEKLVWSYDSNERVNHLNGVNMTCHRDFYTKNCPGTYLYTHEEEIAAIVNERLGVAP